MASIAPYLNSLDSVSRLASPRKIASQRFYRHHQQQRPEHLQKSAIALRIASGHYIECFPMTPSMQTRTGGPGSRKGSMFDRIEIYTVTDARKLQLFMCSNLFSIGRRTRWRIHKADQTSDCSVNVLGTGNNAGLSDSFAQKISFYPTTGWQLH